jgi:hypothetical protein
MVSWLNEFRLSRRLDRLQQRSPITADRHCLSRGLPLWLAMPRWAYRACVSNEAVAVGRRVWKIVMIGILALAAIRLAAQLVKTIRGDSSD